MAASPKPSEADYAGLVECARGIQMLTVCIVAAAGYAAPVPGAGADR